MRKGLEADQEIVCYCTGGVRSSWLYFVLKLAGYQKVRNYPGSWWEWSRDFACPVEKDFQGTTEDPGRRGAGSAFLTVKKRLCKVNRLAYDFIYRLHSNAL